MLYGPLLGQPENGDISWITLLLWALIDFVFSFPDILIKVSKYVIYLEETNYFLFSAWMMTKLLLQAAYLLRHSVSSCFSVLSCGLKAWSVHVEQTKCGCNCCSRQDILHKHNKCMYTCTFFVTKIIYLFVFI